MKALILLSAVLFALPSAAQETTYRHAISGELSRLGSDGFAGVFIDYDYMFKHSARGFFDVKGSLGGYGFTSTWYGYAFRSSLTYNLGGKHHFFELGLSPTYVYEHYENNLPTLREGFYAGPTIGYRSISANGFHFSVYLTEYVGGNYSPFPSSGIVFGKAFGKRK